MALALDGQPRRILDNLTKLGPRKLAGLALVGVLVAALVGLGGYYLSKPDMETLYSGLDRADVTRIGGALSEAGIAFDVNAAGDAVLTPFAKTAEARRILAEKGLPRSQNAGYELFDDLGSIGLTSFMQEITKVRALEGEIARTIQTLSTVRAARVHLVMPDDGSFRREAREPSASVVIRAENPNDFTSAESIRSLVASAIPGMKPSEVTVLSHDGTLLASGETQGTNSPSNLFGMEKIVSRSIEESIRRTLAPYLGLGNFQTSVAATLNTDRRQISETTFDPDSRVERSVRTIREENESQNTQQDQPVGIEQDVQALDEPAQAGGGGEQSSDTSERREELTNYEINEKTVQTTSDGYQVERLSIAVTVDRARIMEAIGENADQAAFDQRMDEIRSLVASAAGSSDDRADRVTVTAVDFLNDETALEPVPGPGFGELFMRQSGTLINALTILVVAALVIWFGLRPAIRAIAAPTPVSEGEGETDGDDDQLAALGIAGFGDDDGTEIGDPAMAFGAEPSGSAAYLPGLGGDENATPQERLQSLVARDDAQAARVLRQWINETKAA